MAWSWQEQGAPPGLTDLKVPLFALGGRGERDGLYIAEASFPPKVEEAPLVTPTDSYLMDKDLGGDVVEVHHVGKGNPHAQESYRQEKRNQVQPEGSDRAPPGTRSVLMSSCADIPTLQKGKWSLRKGNDHTAAKQLRKDAHTHSWIQRPPSYPMSLGGGKGLGWSLEWV